MIWTMVPSCFPSWRFNLTSSFFSLIPNSSLSAMIFYCLTSNRALNHLLILTDHADTMLLLQIIICFIAQTLFCHIYANQTTSYTRVKTDVTNIQFPISFSAGTRRNLGHVSGCSPRCVMNHMTARIPKLPVRAQQSESKRNTESRIKAKTVTQKSVLLVGYRGRTQKYGF